MGKSPGKWIKDKIFRKKSSKSTLSKDATLEKKTSSITDKTASKDFDDSMVISSPVPPVMHASGEDTELEKTSSVNLTNDTIEVVRSNEDELISLEQAAIKAQAAFRGYLARRSFWALKAIILLQAHVRGHLVRRRLQAQVLRVPPPNPEGNLVISTEIEQSHSELEKVKRSLRKISISNAAPSEQSPAQPQPEPNLEPESEPKPEPESEPKLEPEPLQVPPLEEDMESNGKENLKTRRRKSLPAKQEQVECVMQTTPVLPSYMAATESAKAKLRAQAAEDGGENGFIRRHSLPSLTGKSSLQSPRIQKPLQANGKAWNKSNKPQICAREDETVQTGWKR